ncbi:MAG: PIG-L deacetylase family protein [Anaerolineae bacterium]
MKTLLAIFAHPDDESHGPGGTLAKYAREGVAVHYLCATRGEAGQVEDHFLHKCGSIAELRTAELQRAANTLGLAAVHLLNYRDSGMLGSVNNLHPDSLCAAPLDQVAERIARYIHFLQPDVVITHDQYGWYGHPDHIKCHQATLRAYELLYGLTPGAAAARNGHQGPANNGGITAPRLYTSTVPKGVLKLAVRVLPVVGRDPRRFGQNGDIDLTRIAAWEVPVTTRIRVGAYRKVRAQAIACHASQQPLAQTSNPVFRALLQREQAVETFGRVYPPFKTGERLETDLFSRPLARAPGLKAPSAIWGLIGAKSDA